MHNTAQRFGEILTCAAQGRSHARYLFDKEATADLHTETQFWNMLGHAALAECGDERSQAFFLYKRAAENPELEFSRKLADSVIDMWTKQAAVAPATVGRLAAPFAARMAAMSPSLITTMLGAAALGGGAIGGGLYAVKRFTEKDDADMEATKARIEYYDRIRSELQQRAAQHIAEV